MESAEQKYSVESIVSAIRHLTADEYTRLMSELSGITVAPSTLTSFVGENKFTDGVVCPYCGKKHVRRNGHRKDGTQKYVCVDCGKSFTARTNTITAWSRMDLETWKKYIDCMINKLPIRVAASECGISARTSFIWRHKILDALGNMGKDIKLSGIAESDDTYFALSFKGDHSKSKNFDMGRAPRKRGGDGISKGLSEDLVCVPCAVDRKGHSVAKASNLGGCSADDLDHVLGDKITKGSTFCTDGSKAQRKFAVSHKLECIQLIGGKTKRGIFNIQHINSYHSVLKQFIGNFKGVATKYLNNYLTWNNFVNYAKNTIQEKRAVLLNFALSTNKRVTFAMVPSRPAIPFTVANRQNQSFSFT